MAACTADPQTLARWASALLEREPEAPVRVRLLRDVLRSARDCAELERARCELALCAQVQELAADQSGDGGWGRFHSMDTSRRQKIATTEAGVARAIALGLDRPHPIVERARAYLVALLEGRARFPDRPESNDRWETGWKLFTAATLARIDPEHPSLDAHCELWSAVVERTFAGGAYDPDAEALAHAELTGASVRGSYLVLDSKYAVLLLGARAGALPAAIEPLYVSWLCSSPRGLRYMAAPLERPRTAPPSYVDRWLSSLELLAGYPSLGRAGEDAERWLLAQQKAPGVWDLGPRSTQSAALPLSSDWRNASRREADWTARVLCLLAQVRLSQS